jgi:hypothetical protein
MRSQITLVSHTNTGKTTLARTLLGHDVGEVRDAAHVTVEAAAYPLAETASGDRLELWDTPGFGDSARLGRRLAGQGNPIGWFLSQVWDRFRDRPLWLAQKAVRNVRDHADVVLYLVNAAEDPRDAGYLEPELVGARVDRQAGDRAAEPDRPSASARERGRGRAALARRARPLPAGARRALARCLRTLLGAGIHPAARGACGAVARATSRVFDELAAAWKARRLDEFERAMDALAGTHRERRTGPCGAAVVGVARHMAGSSARQSACAAATSARCGNARDARGWPRASTPEIRAGTDALIAIHGLGGRATEDVLTRLTSNVTTGARVSEGKAAMLGGVVSGALSGLVADLASGGLTLGMGCSPGGLVGALGGAGIARAATTWCAGRPAPTCAGTTTSYDGLVVGALLRYLAVAHYGRGRGDWTQAEYPPFWRDVVVRVMTEHRSEWTAIWRARRRRGRRRVIARASSRRCATARARRSTCSIPARFRRPFLMAGSRVSIYGAIAANLAIAVTKFTVGGITGSSAMLSEGIHSLVDTGNGLLLLVGARLSERRSRRPSIRSATARKLYFWGLIVAILIFGSAVGSGLRGVVARHASRADAQRGLELRGARRRGAVRRRELRDCAARVPARARRSAFLAGLHNSKDPRPTPWLAEDGAALLGLALAAAGIFLSQRL